MPGIESRAPERTAKRSGLATLPKPLPRIFSMRVIESAICAPISFGSALPCALNQVQTSVVMVKPGGTGRPMRVISARFAPLPPSSAFILPSPSLRPSPKK